MAERSEIYKGSRRHTGSGMGAVRPHPRPWEKANIPIGIESGPKPIKKEINQEVASPSVPELSITRGRKYLGQIILR